MQIYYHRYKLSYLWVHLSITSGCACLPQRLHNPSPCLNAPNALPPWPKVWSSFLWTWTKPRSSQWQDDKLLNNSERDYIYTHRRFVYYITHNRYCVGLVILCNLIWSSIMSRRFARRFSLVRSWGKSSGRVELCKRFGRVPRCTLLWWAVIVNNP